MTRRSGSTENLHIGFDQASEKATEWPLWLEVSFGILFKGLHTAWRTKVVRSAFIGANHCVRISTGDLHPAHRVHKIFLCMSSHWSMLSNLFGQIAPTPFLPAFYIYILFLFSVTDNKGKNTNLSLPYLVVASRRHFVLYLQDEFEVLACRHIVRFDPKSF